MNWKDVVDFLAHGGIKILILVVAVVAHTLKNRAKQAAKERPPMPRFPNEMPATMQTQTPRANQKTGKSPKEDSPWSSGDNPFDS